MSEENNITVENDSTVAPKKRFDWGVATAVVAVILLLTGIGFASEQLRNSNGTSEGGSSEETVIANDEVTQNFVAAVTSSRETAIAGGIVETYMTGDKEVGKIIYDPVADKELIVVYVEQSNSYFIDIPTNGLTVFAISSKESLDSLSNFNLLYNGKDMYTIQPKENQGDICSGITIKEGLVSQVANISCSEGIIIPDSVITNFSYSITDADKTVFNEGMATGQPASEMQKQQ